MPGQTTAPVRLEIYAAPGTRTVLRSTRALDDGTGGRGRNVVHEKRRLRYDHPVAGADQRLDEHGDNVVRTVSDDDILRGQVIDPGNFLDQIVAGAVRIAVQGRQSSPDGIQGPWTGAQGIFV